jgi:DNA-binding MarR family transcriptional regulator
MDKSEIDPAVLAAIQAFFDASGLMDQMRMRIWDRDGLTITQLRLLGYLLEQGGLSNAELSDRLLVTRPSVSALLERLERGGFIRREVAPNDRRGICIWLEDRGRDAASSARSEVWGYAAGLMENLSPDEVARLTEALQLLVKSGRARRAKDMEADSTVQS